MRRRAGATLVLAALAWSAVPAAGQGLPVGSPAPAVTVPDLDGRPFDLGTVIGRTPVLLTFWATWCPLCEALLPQYEEAAARFGDRVTILGVNVTVNQSKERVRQYLEEHRPPWRTLWDEEGEAVRAYDVLGTSVVVIVDARGRVAYTGEGEHQDVVGELAKVVGR